MVASGDRRLRRSPAGYLVDSIRKGYATPKGFLTRAARNAQPREADDLFSPRG